MEPTPTSATATLSAKLEGDVVNTNVKKHGESLDSQIGKAEGKDWQVLSLDLTGAQIVDSVGLNFLMTLVKRLREEEKTVHVTISSTSVQKVFEFSRLDRVVEVTFKKKRRRR